MRPIKFRAWLEPQNKMETGLFGLRSDGIPSFQSNVDGFKVTLMQFTGLKDENSKDIYEGDSILLNGLKCTIVWNEDRAGFYYDTGYSKHQHQWPLTCDEAIECEVIGNIYEAEQDDQETDCPIHGKCGGTDGECPRC